MGLTIYRFNQHLKKRHSREGALLSEINLASLFGYKGSKIDYSCWATKKLNKPKKPVIPAPEPVSIAQCFLNFLEALTNGYRIKACAGLDPVSGTTISSLFCICRKIKSRIRTNAFKTLCINTSRGFLIIIPDSSGIEPGMTNFFADYPVGSNLFGPHNL